MNMEKGKEKSYLTRAVKGIAQLKVDRIMNVHARNPTSSMEDVLNALIRDILHSEELPLEDRYGSLAIATYQIGLLQGLALVKESGLVSEEVMIKIVSALSPDYEEGEGIFEAPPLNPGILPTIPLTKEEDRIFRSKPGFPEEEETTT
jgi:hypothetical protein